MKIWQLRRNGEAEITSDTKRTLVRTLYDDMQTDVGATPVMVCVQMLATSLAQVYLHERDKLDLPLPSLPLALAAALKGFQCHNFLSTCVFCTSQAQIDTYEKLSTPSNPIGRSPQRRDFSFTPNDTTSILKFITRRFGLDPLPGARKVVSDLSTTFDLN